MKQILKIGIASALFMACAQPSLADNCITQGDFLNQTHSLYTKSLDPYAYLLPDLGSSNDIATSYDLNLKPLVVNDLTRLQFETHDNRSPAAGYTSPYLWEVGQGPSYKARYGNWNGPGFGPGFQPGGYSNFPIPVRR